MWQQEILVRVMGRLHTDFEVARTIFQKVQWEPKIATFDHKIGPTTAGRHFRNLVPIEI